MRSDRFLQLLVAGAALGLIAAAPVGAETVEEFYQGRSVELLISTGPGGGYDTYGRLMARHITKYIPGHPKFVTKNMPGAGGLKLAQFAASSASRDGSVLMAIHRGAPTKPLFDGKDYGFDPRKFNWIGSINNEVSICASWHTSKVRSWNDLMTQELIVGGDGVASDTETFPTVMKNLFNVKLKLIGGYKSGSAVNLAMERGEVNGRCGWSWTSVKSRSGAWLRDKKINVLVQMSLAKHPDLPDVPLVMEMATTPNQRGALRMVFARQAMGRPFFLPPGVPADRVSAMRVAFDKTMKDPKFLAEAKKAKLEVNPMTGGEIGELLSEMYGSPKEVIELATKATRR